MKNSIKFICATVCLSPLVLTGCHTMGELFGDSQNSSSRYSRANSTYSQGQKPANTSSTSNRSVKSTYNKTFKNSSSVPTDPPSVRRGSSSAAKSNSKVDLSDDSANSGTNSTTKNTSTTVPSVQTVAPAAAPGMLAPTVGQ